LLKIIELNKTINIILYLFIISLVLPSIEKLILNEDITKNYSFVEKTEKESTNSDYDSFDDKIDSDLFNKISCNHTFHEFFNTKINTNTYFYCISYQVKQYKQIFSPPPEKA
jgi:hypothetical protein